jgi:SAM-dependent methyltransferase
MPHQTLLQSSAAGSASAQDSYLDLCNDLINGRLDPAMRWSTFCRIAELRPLLRDYGYHAWNYGLRSESDHDVAERARELLMGVVLHFGDDVLSQLAGTVPPETLRSHCPASLKKELRAASSWTSCEERLARAGYATVQEDVLSQELYALAHHYKLTGIIEASTWIMLRRARLNALAAWHAVENILRSRVLPGAATLSLGSGSTQFEEIVSRRLDVGVDAVDIIDPSQLCSVYDRIRYVNDDVEKRIDIQSSHSLNLIILKDVLHELQNPARILDSLPHKLTKEGIILLIEPCFAQDDVRSLRTFRELDSTNHKASFMSHEQISNKLGQDLALIDFQVSPPGVIDNNDSFERGIWIFAKSKTRTQALP